MKFEALNPNAQKYYGMANRRLGLAPHESTHGPIQRRSTTGPIVFSSDPVQSDVPPKIIPVASISHMNELVGNLDHLPDVHLKTPAPFIDPRLLDKLYGAKTVQAFWTSLTQEDIDRIRLAAEVYILGNAERVKEYEPLINALLFPGRIAYFASTEPLVIDAPVVVLGSDPVCWNYDTILIEPGGSLTISTAMKILCNRISARTDGLEATAGQDRIITCTPAGYTKPADSGADRGPGDRGKKGDNAVEQQDMGTKGCPWRCISQPQSGHQGYKGDDGGTGSPGLKGIRQSPLTMVITEEITGNLIINAGGSNGQDGGQGGRGGDGGPGGPPGDKGTHNVCNNPVTDGPQGPAGKGGLGGTAGNGGDGNLVDIYYTSLQGGIQPNYINGQAGKPGEGGIQGNPNGGTYGKGGTGSPGALATIRVQQLPPDFFRSI